MRATLLGVGICAWTAAFASGDELAPPVKLTAAGNPIDVARSGHSAPWLGDIDGDGRNDLLVGEYDEGRCRVFLNHGTNEAPRFREFTWLRAGADLGRVPTG
jgi:hypothetical protein